MTLTPQNSINVLFKNDGLLNRIQTDGRTAVHLDVPDNSADAANKILTADTVKTVFSDSGQDIPLRRRWGMPNWWSCRSVFRRAITRRRSMPRDSIANSFRQATMQRPVSRAQKLRLCRVPTQSAADRGNQTITADKLNARFSPQTKDVERMDAAGNAKFTELDRNAVANRIAFTSGDEILRLRGANRRFGIRQRGRKPRR